MTAREAVEESVLLDRLFQRQKLLPRAEVPLYAQLEALLRASIRHRQLGPGSRLPTEKALQKYFGVSRVTVRQALQSLVRDGLICRCRGRGSEVSPPKIEVTLAGLRGFTAAMEEKGFTVRTNTVGVERVPASEPVAENLEVPVRSRVWRLERVRYVNDERIVHAVTYLPDLPELADAHHVRRSLYDHLAAQGLYPVRTDEYVEAVLATAAMAAQLAVSAGAPLLRRTRRSELVDGRRIEYTVGHYRGDRYRYNFRYPP